MARLSTSPLGLAVFAGIAAGGLTPPVPASILLSFSDPSGLSAEAEFTVSGFAELTVRLKNTSTGAPGGFDNSDQILTGLSWDFGAPGFNGDIAITGGTVLTGHSSMSINFSILNVGPNADVSGEWGFGNMDGTGALTNFFSTNTAGATPFGGVNLDGPVAIDGPQGGLVADPILVALGGLGAIQDEVIVTLTLSDDITEAQLLNDLTSNLVRVEFGSDAFFITIPTPGALALFGLAAVMSGRRRRRTA